jgi:hypothetical protein
MMQKDSDRVLVACDDCGWDVTVTFQSAEGVYARVAMTLEKEGWVCGDGWDQCPECAVREARGPIAAMAMR